MQAYSNKRRARVTSTTRARTGATQDMGMENTPEESAGTSLVRRPGSSLMPAGRGARVVSRMTAGVLDAMRRSDRLAAPERHRVGDVELDGPNYRQVLRWAKELKWTADRVVEVLLDSGDAAFWGHFPEIEDGAIKTLILDGDRFGIARLEWAKRGQSALSQ